MVEYEISQTINSNGTPVKVGWDEYGWFTIELSDEDMPLISFPPEKVDQLIEAIEGKQ